MRVIADKVKAYQLFAPLALASTTTSSAVQITTANMHPSGDAVAVVNVGAATGTPDSFTVVVTITASATSGGSYTALGAFTTNTAGSQIEHLPVPIDPARPFLKATATIAFVNGTSPKIPVSVSILVRQSQESILNRETIA